MGNKLEWALWVTYQYHNEQDRGLLTSITFLWGTSGPAHTKGNFFFLSVDVAAAWMSVTRLSFTCQVTSGELNLMW